MPLFYFAADFYFLQPLMLPPFFFFHAILFAFSALFSFSPAFLLFAYAMLLRYDTLPCLISLLRCFFAVVMLIFRRLLVSLYATRCLL